MSNLKVRLITPGVGAMLKWDGALLGRLVLFSDQFWFSLENGSIYFKYVPKYKAEGYQFFLCNSVHMMASVSGIDDDKLGAVSKSQVRQALLLHNGYKILKLAKDVIQN